jgi:hypothetical protein
MAITRLSGGRDRQKQAGEAEINLQGKNHKGE